MAHVKPSTGQIVHRPGNRPLETLLEEIISNDIYQGRVPTPNSDDNSTQIANTEWVRTKLDNFTVDSTETAGRLQTARSIILEGAVTGDIQFDGSADVTIQTSSDADNITYGLGSVADALSDIDTDLGIIDTALDELEAEKLDSVSGVVTGLKFTVVPLGNINAPVNLDLSTAQEFTATVTGDMTVSFTNAPGVDESQVVYLRLTNPGAFAITWPVGTQFDSVTAPTLSPEGVDLLGVKYDSTTSSYAVFVIGLNVGVPA